MALSTLTIRTMGNLVSRVDIDSYAVVGSSLDVFEPGVRAQIFAGDSYMGACKNIKILNSIRENFPRVRANLNALEFRLLQTDTETVRALFFVENPSPSLKKAFHQEVVVKAVNDLPPKSLTAKTAGNLIASGSSARFSVMAMDWADFVEAFTRRYVVFLSNRNISAGFFYACEHGLKAPPGVVLKRLKGALRANSPHLDFIQIHTGVTLDPCMNGNDATLLLDLNKVLSVFNGPTKAQIYKKYFLNRLGTFSGVKTPHLFPTVRYIQAYETTAHLIVDHNDHSSIFAHCLSGGFKEIDEPLAARNRNWLNQLKRFVNAQKSAGDLRIEIVNDFPCLENIPDTFFDLAGRVPDSISAVVDALIENEVIVQINDWGQYVTKSVAPVIKILEQKCFESSSKPLSQQTLQKVFAFENLLYCWIEGNPTRYDPKVISMVMTSPIEGETRVIKQQYLVLVHPNFDTLPVNPKYRSSLEFVYNQRESLSDSDSDACATLFKLLAASRECAVQGRLVDAKYLNPRQYYDSNISRDSKTTKQVAVVDVVDAVLQPKTLLAKFVKNCVAEVDAEAVKKFVSDFVEFFPNGLIENKSSNPTEFSKVVKDLAKVDRMKTLSANLVRALNLKQNVRSTYSRGTQTESTSGPAPSTSAPSTSALYPAPTGWLSDEKILEMYLNPILPTTTTDTTVTTVTTQSTESRPDVKSRNPFKKPLTASPAPIFLHATAVSTSLPPLPPLPSPAPPTPPPKVPQQVTMSRYLSIPGTSSSSPSLFLSEKAQPHEPFTKEEDKHLLHFLSSYNVVKRAKGKKVWEDAQCFDKILDRRTVVSLISRARKLAKLPQNVLTTSYGMRIEAAKEFIKIFK